MHVCWKGKRKTSLIWTVACWFTRDNFNSLRLSCTEEIQISQPPFKNTKTKEACAERRGALTSSISKQATVENPWGSIMGMAYHVEVATTLIVPDGPPPSSSVKDESVVVHLYRRYAGAYYIIPSSSCLAHRTAILKVIAACFFSG